MKIPYSIKDSIIKKMRIEFLYLIVTLAVSAGQKDSYFSLKEVFKPPTNVNARNYMQVMVASINTDGIDIYKMQELYWKSLCYNGWIFSNSYCLEESEVLKVSRIKSRDWVENSLCYTYENKWDQWGSESVACEENLRTKTVTKTNIGLSKKSVNNHGLRYTCNQEWACTLNKINAPIRLSKSLSTDDFIITLLTANGTLMELAPGENFWEEDGHSYFINNTQHINIKNVKIDCFLDKDKELCLYKGKETIYINGGNETKCYGTVCIQPLGEGTVTYKPRASERRDSLSLESAHEVLDELEFEKELIKYNLNLLQDEIYRTGEIVRELLYSAMKSDDYILGRVLRKPIMTRMISDILFKIYKNPNFQSRDDCKHVEIETKLQLPESENNSELCIESTKISVSNTEELYFDNANEIKLYSSSEDYDVWRGEKLDLEKLSRFLEREGYNYRESSMSDILSMPKGYLNFLVHGQFVTWMVLTIVILVLLSIIIKIRRAIFG